MMLQFDRINDYDLFNYCDIGDIILFKSKNFGAKITRSYLNNFVLIQENQIDFGKKTHQLAD